LALVAVVLALVDGSLFLVNQAAALRPPDRTIGGATATRNLERARPVAPVSGTAKIAEARPSARDIYTAP
jgi:hypothetical protein